MEKVFTIDLNEFEKTQPPINHELTDRVIQEDLMSIPLDPGYTHSQFILNGKLLNKKQLGTLSSNNGGFIVAVRPSVYNRAKGTKFESKFINFGGE